MRSVFARIGAWCVERPGPVIALAVLLGDPGRGRRADPEAERRGGHARRRELGDVQGDRGAQGEVRRRPDRRPHQGRPRAVRPDRGPPAHPLPRGLPRRHRARGRGRRRASRRPRSATSSRSRSPRASSTGRRPSSTSSRPRRRDQFQQQQAAAQEQAEARRAAGLRRRDQGRARQGAGDRSPPRRPRKRSSSSSSSRRSRSGRSTGSGLQLPSIRDPQFVRAVVFDNRFTEPIPKSKFSAFFPSSESAAISVRLRPDLTEEERREAIDQIREAVCRGRLPDPGRLVSRLGRARPRRRPDRRAPGPDHDPLDRGARGDGADAGARLRAAAAPAAARHRPGRERDRVRRAGALRRHAHDGGDRGPADPDRPRGRLRDPAPGALHRGAPRRLVARRAPRPRPRRPAARSSRRPRSRPRRASWS